jgi:hypothetical protein
MSMGLFADYPDLKSGNARFLMAIVLDLRPESCDRGHWTIDLRRHFRCDADHIDM